MEELFVYALLYSVGYDFEKEYLDKLNELFLRDSENAELLYLEEKGLEKEAMAHLISLMNTENFDEAVFGAFLMKKIEEIYRDMELPAFGSKMYKLWGYLPEKLAYEKPFETLMYADDFLAWKDEKQCREVYEAAMNYYHL